MSRQIPIQNLYYLLCYAWDKLEARGLAPVFTDGQRDVTNLMARVLVGTASYVVRRGIDRAYETRSEMMHCIRGRVHAGSTIARTGGLPGRALCAYEELGPDVLHNQIMKAALKRLLGMKQVAAANRNEAAAVLRRLNEVSNVELTPSVFARVRLHRNNAYYSVMLDACKLLLTNSLPSPEGTPEGVGYTMHEFSGEPRDMANLFERFVANFYKREQTRYSVRPMVLTWDNLTGSAEDRTYLPNMRTDVFLESPRSAILIDCKYYIEAFHNSSRNLHVRQDHLRQITTYADRLREKLASTTQLEAMLLYPVVEREKRLDYEAKGYKLTVRFVNLKQDWRQIHRDLLQIAGIYDGDLVEPIGRRFL